MQHPHPIGRAVMWDERQCWEPPRKPRGWGAESRRGHVMLGVNRRRGKGWVEVGSGNEMRWWSHVTGTEDGLPELPA